MLTLHTESHLDHGIAQDIVNYVLNLFKDKKEFFIETIELPYVSDYRSPIDCDSWVVPCGLYGPVMGDKPVKDSEVEMIVRGDRPNPSRMVDRPNRFTKKLTVIAGPHEDKECIVYTMFGGPLAPKEPGDASGDEVKESEKFWSKHALAK